MKQLNAALLHVVLAVALTLSAASGARVVRVEDGATFFTADSLRVQLLGLSAPAIYQDGGDICRDVLEKLVVGRDVRLETDGEEANAQGWLPRYVFTGDTFVNAIDILLARNNQTSLLNALKLIDLPDGLEEAQGSPLAELAWARVRGQDTDDAAALSPIYLKHPT